MALPFVRLETAHKHITMGYQHSGFGTRTGRLGSLTIPTCRPDLPPAATRSPNLTSPSLHTHWSFQFPPIVSHTHTPALQTPHHVRGDNFPGKSKCGHTLFFNEENAKCGLGVSETWEPGNVWYGKCMLMRRHPKQRQWKKRKETH